MDRDRDGIGGGRHSRQSSLLRSPWWSWALIGAVLVAELAAVHGVLGSR